MKWVIPHLWKAYFSRWSESKKIFIWSNYPNLFEKYGLFLDRGLIKEKIIHCLEKNNVFSCHLRYWFFLKVFNEQWLSSKLWSLAFVCCIATASADIINKTIWSRKKLIKTKFTQEISLLLSLQVYLRLIVQEFILLIYVT